MTAGRARAVGAPPAWRMDRWKYYDITHAKHDIMNPLTSEQLDRLVSVADLPPKARAVDIGCGKGEFLFRLARRYRCTGVGVDLSPMMVAQARRRKRRELPHGRVTFVQGDGADHRPRGGVRYDLAACIGASWTFGGYRGTLDALRGLARPGGLVLVGEPFWRKAPPAAYLRASGESRSTFLTHARNVRVARAAGLDLLFVVASTPEEFDVYEGLQWAAADAYARRHPRDRDLAELRQRLAHFQEAYVRWGRDCLAWACYLLRAPR